MVLSGGRRVVREVVIASVSEAIQWREGFASRLASVLVSEFYEVAGESSVEAVIASASEAIQWRAGWKIKYKG
jgi:hypothetical protein